MTAPSIDPSWHIARVIICLCSFGFIFPHALMEKIDAERDAERLATIKSGEPPPVREDRPSHEL